jgi:hypothetical protein
MMTYWKQGLNGVIVKISSQPSLNIERVEIEKFQCSEYRIRCSCWVKYRKDKGPIH